MLKSVEEVANELGVSKTAIYNKLKLNEYKDLVIKKQGRSMIDETLFNLIKENLKFKNIVDEDSNEVNEDENSELNGNISEINEDMLKELLNQLNEKDKQIKELHKLIENSQVLLREKNQTKEEQLLLEEHFKEVDLKLETLKEKMEDKRKSKKGLFSFFKKRNKE